jgi:hypothetical protein
MTAVTLKQTAIPLATVNNESHMARYPLSMLIRRNFHRELTSDPAFGSGNSQGNFTVKWHHCLTGPTKPPLLSRSKTCAVIAAFDFCGDQVYARLLVARFPPPSSTD